MSLNTFLFKREHPDRVFLNIESESENTRKNRVSEHEIEALLFFLSTVEMGNLINLTSSMTELNIPHKRGIHILKTLYGFFQDTDELYDFDVPEELASFIHEETDYDNVYLVGIEVSDKDGSVHVVSESFNKLLAVELQEWIRHMMWHFPDWPADKIFPFACNVLTINTDKWLRWIATTEYDVQIETLQMLNQLEVGLDAFINQDGNLISEINLHM